MEKLIIEQSFVSPEERARLVRCCAMFTGDVDAAEDLVQETLLEAWRCEHTLRDRSLRSQWLTGIARNICLRWLRKRGRDMAHLITPSTGQNDQEAPLTDLEDALADDFDIEVELEQKELIELLDRALALLPDETRTVLIKRYVEEAPLAEIAAQLNTNASAVAMRLQRGKLSLRRVLTNELRHEIAPYIIRSTTDEWEETPLWCHICGQRRLLGRRNPEEGRLVLKCPICSPEANEVVSKNNLPLLQGVKGYKPLYSRLTLWCDNFYRTALGNNAVLCPECGRPLKALIVSVEDMPDWVWDQMDGLKCTWPGKERVVCIPCPSCRTGNNISLESLIVRSQEGRQFLQAHPRVRALPKQEVEVDGRLAIITRHESVTDNATLIAISDYETYQLLRVYEES